MAFLQRQLHVESLCCWWLAKFGVHGQASVALCLRMAQLLSHTPRTVGWCLINPSGLLVLEVNWVWEVLPCIAEPVAARRGEELRYFTSARLKLWVTHGYSHWMFLEWSLYRWRKAKTGFFSPPRSCCDWKRKYCFTNTYWPHGFRKTFGVFHLFMSLRKGKMGDFSQHGEVTSRTREQWWMSWALFSAWRINVGLNQSRGPKNLLSRPVGNPKSSLCSILSCWQPLPRSEPSLSVLAGSAFLPFDAAILSYTLSSLLWDEDVEGFPSHHKEMPAVLKEAKI